MPQLSTTALNWLSTILEERFGHTFILSYQDSRLHMRLEEREGVITFPVNPAFIQPSSNAPCGNWNADNESFVSVIGGVIPAPCVTELPSPLISVNAETRQARIDYDLIGLTYWMLNRIEEIGSTELDNHSRFPATSSHALKHDYLDRPVVDEWLHVLGQVVQKVWSEIELKQHQFSMKVSHDVDRPSRYVFRSWPGLFRAGVGDLLRRRDIKSAFLGPFIKIFARGAIPTIDPYNTFDWLMNVSERHGLISAFYFICGRTSNIDADYEPESRLIQELIQRIHQRGHEIGLHPSYGTYQKPELIKQEAERLRTACSKVGVSQTEFGGRMHYLRWEHPTTLQAWEDAGMTYDTTLGYADHPGFRCGTCFEYPAFNPVTQKPLKIRIRPLIVMEGTVIATHYLGLGVTKLALDKFIEMKDNCRKVGGCFTLLWHNSELYNEEQRNIYEKVVQG